MKRLTHLLLALTVFLPLAGMGQNPASSSLSTTLASGNGQDGVMFNIKPSLNIIVRQFTSSWDGSAQIEIYYRKGGYNANSSSGWVKVGTTSSITGGGDGKETLIPLKLNLAIPAGDTYGFYITTLNGGMNYTNGDISQYSTKEIAISDGIGKSYPFGGTYNPRMWNGTMWYDPVTAPNDAGIAQLDSPTVFCGGTQDIYATVKNFGINQVDSVRVNWSVDGTPQKTIFYKSLLDTNNGKGKNSVMLKLGSLTWNNSKVKVVKVWTSFPNGKKDTVNNNDTVTVPLRPSMSGKFTIGGSGADYSDVMSAIQDLNDYGVCGPVQFDIAAGSYSGNHELKVIDGASATNTITFIGNGASGSSKTTITNSASSSEERATILFNGADYVTFRNCEITATGSSYGYGVHFISNADHNTVDSCAILVSTSSTSSNYIPVVGSGSRTSNGSGNSGNYNTISNNLIRGGYYGIRWYGSGSSDKVKGNHFLNNRIEQAYYYGTYAYYHDSIEYIGNTIRNVRNSSSGDGVYAMYWSNCKFNYNDVEAGDYGVYFYYNNSTLYNGTTQSEFYSNIIYSDNDYGLRSYRSENTKYYNNTVYSDDGSYAAYFYYPTNLDAKNNIFAAGDGYAFYHTGGNVTDLDYNIYYNWQGTLIYDNSTYSSLAAWQAGTSYNQHSLEQDPGFVQRPGDLHLTNATNAPRGAALGVEFDIDGETRCKFAPTIGGDEGQFPNVPVNANFQQVDTIWQNSYTTILNSASANAPEEHTWYVDGKMVSNNLHLTGTFTQAGTIEVKLVTESCGGIDSVKRNIVVSPATRAPEADFVADNTDPEIFEGVQFKDISQNGPTSYKWIIKPDTAYDPVTMTYVPSYTILSGTDSSANPVISFDYEGQYDVCHVASNSKGSDTICRNNFIFIKSAFNLCIFPDFSNAQKGILYDEGGPTANYSSNSNCDFLIDPCASEVSLNISEFDLGSSDYLRVFDGSDNTGTPLWDAANYPNGMEGDMNSNSFKQKLVAKSGKMFIEFSSNNSTSTLGPGFKAEWNSVPKTVSPPNVSFQATDTACVNISVDFENLTTGDEPQYEWLVDNSIEGTSADFDYTFNTKGTYDVTLRVTNCGGTRTFTKSIVVDDPKGAPTADFDVSNDKPVLLENVLLSDKSTYCRDYWRWEISPSSFQYANGTDSSSQNPVIQFLSAGQYTVKLVTGNATAKDSITKTNVIQAIRYCIPSVAFLNSDLGISRFVLGDIDNSSSVGDAGYTDYSSSISTTLEKGAEYPVILERNTTNHRMSRKVWIDFNRDGDFDDAGELVVNEAPSYNRVFVDTFKVPQAARNGITKLRISTNSGTNANTACGPHFNGEFEDYEVVISPDIAAPEITLIGADTIYLTRCESYVEQGATAVDNVDGNISSSITITSNIDPMAGNYQVTYQVEDLSGNEAAAVVRHVIRAEDKSAPVVSLIGKAIDTLDVFGSYTDPGVNAFDSCIGVDTIMVSNSIDNTMLGRYEIVYTAIDSMANKTSVTRYVDVVDRTAPVINLNGKTADTIDVNDLYVFPVATVSDNYDKNPSLVRTDNINTKEVGEYAVVYCAEDASGNQAICKTVKVYVLDRVKPSASLIGDDTLYVEVFSNFVDPGVEINDNYYRNSELSIVKSGSWTGSTDELGSYSLIYTVSDPSGNDTVLSRLIVIVDSEAPDIRLNGSAVVTVERWADWTDPGATATDNYDQNPDIVTDGDYENSQSEGIYYIGYTAEDASGNKSVTVYRTIIVEQSSTGVPVVENDVEIYPNPTNGQLNIRWNLGNASSVNVTLLDALGKTIYSQNGMSNSGTVQTIDISSYQDGVYFLKIESDGETRIERIIKR